MLGTGVVAESGWLGDIANQTLCPPELAEHADPGWQVRRWRRAGGVLASSRQSGAAEAPSLTLKLAG